MPHKWYAHQLFWILSAIINAAIIGLRFVYDPAFRTLDDGWKIKFLVTHSISCLLSFILAALGLLYNHD